MAQRNILPRPEYPRPDRQRGVREGFDWINLNGPWEFRFDPDRRGEEEEWFQQGASPWREQINVPFCWESLAAWGEADQAGNEHYYSRRPYLNPLEITNENYRSALRYEIGWYRRNVSIPANEAWSNKRVILTVGAADFFTKAWCNGICVGEHEGGYTPFEFDITDALEENPSSGELRGLLVFRVEDPMQNSEQPVGKQWRWYTPTSGIWQTVFLEPRSSSHIDRFRIISDIDKGVVRFRVKCDEAEDCTVQAEVLHPEGSGSQTFEVKVRGQTAEKELRIRSPMLWDPNHPYLYRVVFRLMRDGEVLDLVHSYFGMRKLDTAPAEDPKAPAILRFNNQPRYLRGALYQSYYPEGVYTAGSFDQIRYDLESAKHYGFNFLRVHIKIDDPLVYYWADRIGLLVMADFPNFGEGGDTEIGRKRFEAMMRAAIDRDFNHPCIIAWCLFNETWGFGGQVGFVDLFSPAPSWADPRQPLPGPQSRIRNLSSHAWVKEMWTVAQQLDDTRLIEDMSVCHWKHLEYFLHGETDINSWHFYDHDYHSARAHIEQVVQNTYMGSEFNYVPGFSHGGEPLINSEYGGVGALDGDRDISWSFKFLTNELRRHGAISAYIFTELTDVEWEYNGFLNYDRTPKEFGFDPRIINESDQLPLDAPPVQRVAPGGKVRIPVASSHYSTRMRKNVRLRWRLDGEDTRGRIHQRLLSGEQPIKFPHRRVEEVAWLEFSMPAFPVMTTLSIEAITEDLGEVIARNFVDIFVSEDYPPAEEDDQRTTIRRLRPQDWCNAEWSGAMSSREEAAAEDSCYGVGVGFFEWSFPIQGLDLSQARRLRILCEASSRRETSSQTDCHNWETELDVSINGVTVHRGILPNHPHDSRGSLSYLRGAKGAYGYLVSPVVDELLLGEISRNVQDDHLILRCETPADTRTPGGLTIYGAECGRSPICPTLIIEW